MHSEKLVVQDRLPAAHFRETADPARATPVLCKGCRRLKVLGNPLTGGQSPGGYLAEQRAYAQTVGVDRPGVCRRGGQGELRALGGGELFTLTTLSK